LIHWLLQDEVTTMRHDTTCASSHKASYREGLLHHHTLYGTGLINTIRSFKSEAGRRLTIFGKELDCREGTTRRCSKQRNAALMTTELEHSFADMLTRDIMLVATNYCVYANDAKRRSNKRLQPASNVTIARRTTA
jgi:hypothetical protein